jgi:signal peptidase I
MPRSHRVKTAVAKRIPRPPRPASDEPRGGIAGCVLMLIPLLFGTTTLVQAFVIPTGSMEDNLLIGDHLLVDKLSYAPAGPLSAHLLPYQEPKHGDIIVFRRPDDLSLNLVKRLIGVPGDRIRLVNKQVYRNGRKVYEPYTFYKTDFIDPYRDNFPAAPSAQVLPRGMDMLEHNVVNGELVVPPGCYFAMGDNRDNSLDSRYWGFVPRENIIGKPILIYWSYDAPTEDLLGPAINIDHLVDVFEHFFTKTRWRRTFKLVRGYPG